MAPSNPLLSGRCFHLRDSLAGSQLQEVPDVTVEGWGGNAVFVVALCSLLLWESLRHRTPVLFRGVALQCFL